MVEERGGSSAGPAVEELSVLAASALGGSLTGSEDWFAEKEQHIVLKSASLSHKDPGAEHGLPTCSRLLRCCDKWVLRASKADTGRAVLPLQA